MPSTPVTRRGTGDNNLAQGLAHAESNDVDTCKRFADSAFAADRRAKRPVIA